MDQIFSEYYNRDDDATKDKMQYPCAKVLSRVNQNVSFHCEIVL